MTLKSPRTFEEKLNELRDYIDKHFKPKKQTMGNLDREVVISFVTREAGNVKQQELKEIREKVAELRKDCLYIENVSRFENDIKVLKDEVYNQALKDVDKLIELRKAK